MTRVRAVPPATPSHPTSRRLPDRATDRAEAPGRRLARHGLYLAVLVAAVVLGRSTRLDDTSLSLVWPAAGLAVLWLVDARRRGGQPAVLAAIGLVTLLGNVGTGVPPAAALVIAVANTVQAWVVCAVHARLRGDDWTMRRGADLPALLAAAGAGVAASATLVVPAAHLLLGSPPWLTLLQWSVRNLGSVVVLVSLGLVLAERRRRTRRGSAATTEALLCHASLATSLAVVFVVLPPEPIAWAVLAVVIWAGTRLSTTAAAWHAVVVTVTAVAATLAGRGPFSPLDPLVQVLLAHGFVVMIVAVGLLLALDRDERAAMADELAARTADIVAGHRAAELAGRQLHEAIDGLPDLLYVTRVELDDAGDVATALVERANSAARRSADLPDQELAGRHLASLFPEAASERLWDDVVGSVTTGVPRQRRLPPLPVTGQVLDVLQVPLPGGRLLSRVQDITRQVEREALLADAYEETAGTRVLLQAAIDAMVDGLLVHRIERDLDRTGPDGRGDLVGVPTVLANSSAADRLGLPVDDVVGTDLRDLLETGLPVDVWETVERTVTTGAPHTVRVHHRDGDDAWVWSEDVTFTACGEDQLVTLFRDATHEEQHLRAVARDRETAVHAASHDFLTGLPNRSSLRRHLEHALTVCAPGDRVAVVFVDLDGFKAVNDTWGHAAGDDVLRAVAGRLSEVVRAHDIAARLSGDEFVLVLRELTDEWDSARFLDRARRRLAEPVDVHDPVTGTGSVVHPAASFGLVLVDPADPDEPAGTVGVDGLLARADAAMYEQKRERHGVQAEAASRVPSPRA